MNFNLCRFFPYVLAIASISVMIGCATPASQSAMTVGMEDLQVKQSPSLKGQLSVDSVVGGTETNPMWKSKVDNISFKGALEQSLTLVGYRATNPGNAKYHIDVTMQDLDQPSFGMTFDVRSTVLYTLRSDGNQKTFPVAAVGTATPSDSMMAIERLRIANERSIKENIKQFIRDLSTYFSSISEISTTLQLEDAQKKCAELGFLKGTENFGNCVLKVAN